MGLYRTFFALMNGVQRRRFGALLLMMMLASALEAASAALVVPVLATVTGSGEAAGIGTGSAIAHRLSEVLGLHQAPSPFLRGALLLVLAFSVKSVISMSLAWRESQFAFGMQRDLSLRLFAGYLHRPYVFHLNRNSAQLVRNITTEVAQFTFNFTLPAVTLLSEGMVVLALLILLFWVEPIGASVALGVLAIGVGLSQFALRSRLAAWGAARQASEGTRLQHLQQGLGAVKEVILTDRATEFAARFAEQNAVAAATAQRHLFAKAVPRILLEWLCVVALGIMLLVLQWGRKDPAGLVPAAGLFAAAAFRLLPSVNRIVGAIQSLRFCAPVVQLLDSELCEVGPMPVPAGRGRSSVLASGKPPSDVSVDSVTFSYGRGGIPALSGVSLEIPAGSCIGVIGESGGGKSTLVDVLLGLIEPDSGTIRVAGRDIREDLRGWQSGIGYVPQTIYLTDDTLRRNIAFGIPDAEIDTAAVEGAIRNARLDEFVNGLPEGLETRVGERGARLSGGQRQRIGIARALYHRPSFLVLDEATSALDPATEADVMDSIRGLAGNRTIVIVTHRMATLRGCSAVYRIEGGRLRPDAVRESSGLSRGGQHDCR